MTTENPSSAPREFPYKQGNPWLGVDRRDDYEEYIAGNRAGLEALRSAIDNALKDGKSEISIPFTDYPGIVLVEGDPREADQQKPKAGDWIAGCLNFLLVPAMFLGGMAIVIVIAKWLWKFLLGK